MKNVIIISFIFIFSLFFISDVKADTYNTLYDVYINGTLNFAQSDGDNYDGNYVAVPANTEVNMTFDFHSFTTPKYGDNLLVTVTFCSTGTYYGSILTPGYDLTGAILIRNYSITNSGTSCSVGGYTGTIYQSVWNLSVPGTSFWLHSWAGNRDNYTVLVDIYGVTVQDFDQSMAILYEQNQKNQTIIDQNNTIINSNNETNNKLDDITDMDIPDSSKEDLDDSSYQDYQGAEDDLMDSVGEADLSNVDIAIDTDSSNFIWDTITDIFQSHPLIMSTVIAILSIGIIKLALGR